jgi:hypothetical protein
MVMVIFLLIILHITVYIVGFLLIAKKENYKYAIASIITTYGIVYTPYIEKFIKPDFEVIWLKVIIVIFSYLTSLMLFLLIKKVFIKNE